ncbi:MAG: nucleotide sugar dehydrogenase [Anaerolineae bacterium]
MALADRIENKTAHICVLGLGYVGLPLAVGLAEAGYRVTGLDVDEARVRAIQEGRSYILDVSAQDIARLVAAQRLWATTDYDILSSVDIVFICVPTPFDAMKAPDLSAIIAAATGIAKRLRHEQLIILQSTTYPGTTEEKVLPILEQSGLRAGQDFYLAFSPERINPGDKVYHVGNLPKVVGGLTSQCADLAQRLLSQLSPVVHVVSSPRAAEMSKLLENIFRSVNIALVNELALLCERMGIDIWEVIQAAATKPFGFMPFYPGPGTGGHCIPVDPYYLSWKAREYDFYTKFIELAAEVNQSMPYHVVDLIIAGLDRHYKVLRGSKILILGVAFKKDVDDARNSPAERIIELLLERGAEVCYNDPHVPHFRIGQSVFYREKKELTSQSLTERLLAENDCVVIVAGHSCYDYAWIASHCSLLVDTVNATQGLQNPQADIIKLGTPWRLNPASPR